MKKAAVVAFGIVCLFVSVGGYGERIDVWSRDPYYPSISTDPDMREIKTGNNMLTRGVQFGAWIMPAFVYEETPERRLATSVTTYRAWLKTYLWNNSFLFVRGKDTHTAVLKQSGVRKQSNRNVIDLDLGFISIGTANRIIDVSLGRKYFLIGSGLVCNGRGDGIEVNLASRYLTAGVLAYYTGFLAKDDNPYGLSDRDLATGARRLFAGGIISTRWFNQRLYLFGLGQRDFGKEYADKRKLEYSFIVGFDQGIRYYGTKSRYHSQYWGVGLDGTIVSGLTYRGEFIGETGTSYHAAYAAPGSVKSRVQAFAAILNVNYYFNVVTRPVLSVRYAFGSGDVNRDDYRNPIGNLYGRDRGFLYFGTFVGGYAFRPFLGNMHVLSGMFAWSPLSWSRLAFLNRMTLYGSYHYYLKHKAAAAVNYGWDATRPKREIGHGIDLSFRWSIFQDMGVFVNYGVFLPGKAYGLYYERMTSTVTFSSTSKRHFLMAGCNVSF